ncbi:hypothetical protein GCM10027059_22820 [Myceligenerans halotolerans]
MRFGSRLWASGVVWLAPLAVGVGVAWLFLSGTYGYPSLISAGANGAWVGAEISTVIAFGGAVSGVRLRQARWDTRPHARALPLVLAEMLWPHVVCGAIALLAATGLALAEMRVVGVPNLWPVFAEIFVVAAAGVFGCAAGVRLAAPVALLGAPAAWWFVLAFRASVEPAWIRHLGGVVDCCELYETVNPLVLAATALTAIAAIVVWYLVIDGRRAGSAGEGWKMRGAWGGVAVALVVVAVVLVRPLDWSPAIARSGQLACAGDAPRVCMWPEQAELLDRVADTAHDTLAGVHRGTGVPVPTTLTQDHGVVVSDEVRAFTLTAAESRESLIVQIASAAAVLPEWTCLESVEKRPGWSGWAPEPMEASSYSPDYVVNAWWSVKGLAAAAAMNEAEAVDQVVGIETTDDRRALDQVLALPVSEQARWVDQAQRAFAACDPESVPSLPGGWR